MATQRRAALPLRLVVPVLLAGALAASPAAGQLHEKWGVPGSPTGQAVAQVLEMIARGDDGYTRSALREAFAPGFVDAFPEEAHLSVFRQLHRELPDPEPQGIMRTAEGARFGVRSAGGGASVSITLAVDPDGRIAAVVVEDGGEGGADPASSPDAPLPEAIETWAAEDRFSGVVLDTRGGEAVMARAVGMADKRHGVPVTPDTRFNIGSINKDFTGLAILLLEREGLVELDAPLGRYLDGFPPEVAEGVTVRHLLTHRSGWGHYWENEAFLAGLAGMRQISDYLAFIRHIPLDFEPGSREQYSNVGYEVLGGIVEAVSGEAYHDFVRERIFRPLGMDDTDFLHRDRPEPRVAVGYVREHPWVEDGPYAVENTYLLPPVGTAAGGAYATAGDLVRFWRGLQEGALGEGLFATILNQYDEEAGWPGGPSVMAGGAPGVRAVTLVDPSLDRVAVVLSNYDTPVVREIVSRLEAAGS